MQYAVSFILGLVIGSFLNVCIHRIPSGKSVAFSPSCCPDCGERIRMRHMVPIVSYILLGGRCSCCRIKISPKYPLVELLTGVLFVLLMYRFGPGMEFYKYAFLLSLLTAAGFIDFEHQIIPDILVIAGITAGIVFMFIDMRHPYIFYIAGGLLGGGILLAVDLVSRGGMGGGDIKLMTVIGLFLGWQSTLLVLFLAFVTGGMAGVLMLVSGRKNRKDAVSFGPFIGGASVAAVFFGHQLTALYLSFFY